MSARSTGHPLQPIMADTHPLVAEGLRLAEADQRTLEEISCVAGIDYRLVWTWRRKRVQPHLLMFESYLNTLGYRLAILPTEARST